MKDQVVVISGGATGIGFAIATELSDDNIVVSIDRTPSKVEALKERLPGVVSLRADLTSAEQRHEAVATIERRFGRIDVLINNAGKAEPFDFVGTSEDELMRAVASEIAINYEAPILLTKRALPLLQKSAEPVVVIMSTGLVYAPLAEVGTYCASKRPCCTDRPGDSLWEVRCIAGRDDQTCTDPLPYAELAILQCRAA